MTDAITVRNLTRTYRTNQLVLANDDLTFSVGRGEVFGVLGANGAGKTTLVSQLLGLVRPTSGSITVEGVDVMADPDGVKRITGFLPQTELAMRELEVRRALHYTGRLRGQGETDARRQTDELLDELGLGPVSGRYVNQLSGGMMRLVNFGMALMGRPKLLVLDEPTNELDPHNRRLVWDVLARRSAAEGATVVLVTHNVLEAESVVDRVAVMRQGRIVTLGSPGELKHRLGDTVRMELQIRDGGELGAAELALLGATGTVVPGTRDGRYLVHCAPARMPELVTVVTEGMATMEIEDFRLSRPSLEDVYLNLDDEPATSAPSPVSSAAPSAAATAPAGVAVLAPVTTVPPPARPPLRDRLARGLTSFKYLWLEQMLEVRSTWWWSLLFGFLMPVAMVFGLTRIGGGLTDQNSLLYIVSGAAVFSVATEGIATLAQRVGVVRTSGMLQYYVSLPISRTAFLSALVFSRLLLILPGLVTPIIAARLMYDADFVVSPMLLVVLPLTCLALSAVGLAIGTVVESMDVIVVITNLLIFVLLLAAPVLIPPESLPLPLRLIGYLLPPTYAAEALRHALSGDLGGMFLVDVAVLLGMTVLGLAATSRWIRWRIA
ncbi:ABC-2 type transport system permease protein [Lentzea fradiae]|uniref:Transport permease protein n=1 Tax=Lentzea fradiae TaxID=200378 RepID=A0A1G8DEM8_9PSEU|nr:ABC transporter ATP-binding protein/permease [Lentzea fradiae]SDH56044.1 ABC-2 type transport system permease protein [Lentzea fradiae]